LLDIARLVPIVTAMKPFNPHEPVRVTRQDLPHWRQEGTTYFVTSRLADSVPHQIAEQWRAKRDLWLAQHHAASYADLPEGLHLDYTRLFTDTFHELLDAGHGECVLARPACADILVRKMLEGHGACFRLGAWCVMPNHFHALVEPAKGTMLGHIVQHWKGGSAFAVNRLLGRRGALWQAEPFDHIVRSEAQLARLSAYVADNPQAARLESGFVLGFGGEAELSRSAMQERCAQQSRGPGL
jgi:REP element-mobilizing transposase RayT